MEIPAHTYNEANLTTFASYRTESAAALFALALADEKGWPVDRICRALDHIFLSGGKSGKLRNEEDLNISVRTIRSFIEGEVGVPDALRSFTWTPLMKKIGESP